MTLADLQEYLGKGLVNPNPPVNLMVGETAFCTLAPKDGNANPDRHMWVVLVDKDMDLGKTDVKYKIAVNSKDGIWVEAKYIWTKQQVQRLAHSEMAYVAPWDDDLKLPRGVKIADPEAALQALLNLMRDAKVMGRAGGTNLPAVKCNVDGLMLGHFYKIQEALGSEACLAIHAIKLEGKQ